MHASTVIAGLIVVHILWAAAYIVGALVMVALDVDQAVPEGVKRVLDFVTATAVGIAVIVFALFGLGVAHELNAAACTVAWFVVAGSLAVTQVMRRGFSATLVAVGRPLSAFSDPAVVGIYAVAVVLSVPAVLPPTAWDATMYHLPNSVDWARAGYIYSDQYLRSPFNAFNFELLCSLAFVFKVGRFVLFVSWLPFACTAIGIYGLTSWLLERRSLSHRAGAAIGIAATAAFLGSPLVLDYGLTGLVDVGTGFMLFATTTATLRALQQYRSYGPLAAIIGGSFVGMKIQLALFVPLVGAALIGAGLLARVGRRSIAIALITFVVAAAPWYARNLIIAGDPLSPVFNVLLGRHDPIYNRSDYEGLQWNLHYGDQSILDAPRDFLLNRTPPYFLYDPGTSTSVALVVLVPIVAVLCILLRRRFGLDRVPLALLCISSSAIVAILAVSTKIGRYTLTYFPLLVVTLTYLGTIALIYAGSRIGPRGRRLAIFASVLLTLLLATPEPRNASAYVSYLSSLSWVDAMQTDPDRFLQTAGDGDFEAIDLAHLLNSAHASGTVLALRYENAAYYFRANGIVSLGDWFGPARYADLATAIEEHTLPQYFDRFRIDAVLLGRRYPGWSPAMVDDLLRTLHDMHFVEVGFRGDGTREFIRKDIVSNIDRSLLAEASRTVFSR